MDMHFTALKAVHVDQTHLRYLHQQPHQCYGPSSYFSASSPSRAPFLVPTFSFAHRSVRGWRCIGAACSVRGACSISMICVRIAVQGSGEALVWGCPQLPVRHPISTNTESWPPLPPEALLFHPVKIRNQPREVFSTIAAWPATPKPAFKVLADGNFPWVGRLGTSRCAQFNQERVFPPRIPIYVK